MKKIITTGGGLGNQIMSYALWLYLKECGDKSILYLRRNNLSDIFAVKNPCLKRNIIIEYYIYIYKFFIRVTRFLANRLHCSFLNVLEKIFPIKVIDYPEWDDYKFMPIILPKLKEGLSFPLIRDQKNLFIQRIIMNNNSVSIHIRRGDYQTVPEWRILLGDICDVDYYGEAIKKVCILVKDPVFFIFSDDINWAQVNLKLRNAYYINWNIEENAYRDMQLMSMCKVNILANSTFSLCATWLNINENPIRIVPSKWHNQHVDCLFNKYVLKDWIVIDNKKPQVSIVVTSMISTKEIRNILKQKYSDFELILPNDTLIKDDRIIINNNPKGKFVYYYNKFDFKKFKNAKFLASWLLLTMKKEIDKDI